MSELTDSELIIFDLIWDGGAPLRLLYRDRFPWIANTPYSHSIPDEKLKQTLLDLVDRGFMTVEQMDIDPRWGHDGNLCFGLTEAGGAAWELERNPDWSRYIDDCREDVDSADGLVVISAISEDIGLRFLECCREARLWGELAPTHSHRILDNAQLLPWKRFPKVHCFEVAVVSEDEPSRTDWRSYERQRVWWRGARELISPNPIASANE